MSNKLKKILVLGSSGFIGGNLAKSLQKSGHDVVTFSRQSDGDYGDLELVSKKLKDVDVVYHLITATHPAHANQDLIYDLNENVIKTIKLIELCVKFKIKKFIYLSSAGTVYGIPEALPLKENHSLNPISPYGLGKVSVEHYLNYFNYHFGLDYIAFRPTNPYGPGQDFKKGLGAITNFIEKIKHNTPLEIWGDGSARRDYIYIDDTIGALMKAHEIKTTSKIFNLGTGIGTSLNELIALLENKAQKKVIVNYHPKRDIDVPDNTVDISLIKNELSWSPQFTIKQGIDKYWSYLSTKEQSS